MNRKALISLLVTAAMLLAGCGASGNEKPQAQEAQTSAEETVVEEGASVEETEEQAEEAPAEETETASESAAAGSSSAADEAESTPEPTEMPKPEPTGPPAADVFFDPYYTDDFKEVAEITGLDSAGKELWFTKTDEFPGTDLTLCDEIGIENNMFYYVENGTVVTLDLRDGSRIWENRDFGGSSPTGVFDEEGTLYLCGYDHPDLFVVDKNGRTKRKVESFSKNYSMPGAISIEDGTITIQFDSNGGTLKLDKSTLKIKSRVAPAGGYSDAQLVAMARNYSGVPNAVIDLTHLSNNEVEMQLYIETDDGYQNIGAYWVDPMTGEGQDPSGSYVDLRSGLSDEEIAAIGGTYQGGTASESPEPTEDEVEPEVYDTETYEYEEE